jgi:hypothetical protein
MSSDPNKKVVIKDKQMFVNGQGNHGGQQKGCWSLDDIPNGIQMLKIGGQCDVTSIKLPADIKATAYTTRKWGSWSDMCNEEKVVDIEAGTTKDFKSGTVCAFKFSKVN